MAGDYPATAIGTRLLPPFIGAAVVSWDSTWGSVAKKLPGGQMADANTDNGQLRSAGSVELRVAAKLENLAVLRTLVAAVGTFEDLDFDAASPSTRPAPG
jgi:hypothetical protein